MFLDITQGTIASTLSLGTGPLPEHQHKAIHHLLFGSLTGVRFTIQNLHKKYYAQPNDWSKPISTGRPNEVMVILTKWVAIKE